MCTKKTNEKKTVPKVSGQDKKVDPLITILIKKRIIIDSGEMYKQNQFIMHHYQSLIVKS